MKLVKVNSNFYQTEDGRFCIKKEWANRGRGGRIVRVWRFYRDGRYQGEPETIKMANDWIKYSIANNY